MLKLRKQPLTMLALTMLSLVFLADINFAAEVHFNEQIRPILAEHCLHFDKQAHLVSGFDQRRIGATHAHTKLCIEQACDQSGLKKLRLIGFTFRDQHRSLTHPLFSLGSLQILDTLNQPENG